MASYIETSTAASSGEDFTLAPGASTTLSLSGAAGIPAGCTARIEIKSAAETYQVIGLLSKDSPALVLQAAGTFRVVKGSNPDFPFGVERD